MNQKNYPYSKTLTAVLMTVDSALVAMRLVRQLSNMLDITSAEVEILIGICHREISQIPPRRELIGFFCLPGQWIVNHQDKDKLTFSHSFHILIYKSIAYPSCLENPLLWLCAVRRYATIQGISWEPRDRGAKRWRLIAGRRWPIAVPLRLPIETARSTSCVWMSIEKQERRGALPTVRPLDVRTLSSQEWLPLSADWVSARYGLGRPPHWQSSALRHS